MKKLLLLLVVLATLQAVQVHAQSTPVINTYKDATGTSISISLPSDFNGSFTTVFDGKKFQTTYSTSTVIDDRLKKAQAQIWVQQKALNEFLQAQKKMFDTMWSNWWW
jgi:hypothetical protein